jgi:hypothetical protein
LTALGRIRPSTAQSMWQQSAVKDATVNIQIKTWQNTRSPFATLFDETQ